MKRKRGAGRGRPRKSSVVRTSEPVVNPRYYSDSDGHESCGVDIAEAENSQLNANIRAQDAGIEKMAVNNETVGSAAAKLARYLSQTTNVSTDGVPPHGGRIFENEAKLPHPDPGYNEEELNNALLVIKRIMKMDAAEPFNIPVDPVALGIPDYFDIIDIPMDFGTICNNLENGVKYMNSEDVFKDVQCIWDNCCKYNKKGDYILELMKRVKNNFMKHWTAAELYKEQTSAGKGHVGRDLQTPAESTMGAKEVEHLYPICSTISRPTHQKQDWTCPSQRQQHHLLPCCGSANKPQHLSTPSCCLPQPRDSQHCYTQSDTHISTLRHKKCMHSCPADLANGNSCKRWQDDERTSLAPASQFLSSCRCHPQQGNYHHQSSSVQLLPSQLRADINHQTAGHLHLSAHSDCEHACNGSTISNNYQQCHIQTHHSSAKCITCQPPHSTCRCHSNCSHLQDLEPEAPRDTTNAGNSDMLPHMDLMANSGRRRNASSNAGNMHLKPQRKSTTDCSKQRNESSDVETHLTPLRESIMNSNTRRTGPSVLGNLHVPPPMDSVMNSGKCREESPVTPITDDAHCQQQEPLEPTHESLSHLINSQVCQAQENASPVLPEPDLRHSEPSSPEEAFNATNASTKRKSGGRGPARCLWMFSEGRRIPITTNEHGQPIGPESMKLTSFLGMLARNGNNLPLNYVDWRSIPDENKEKMWEKVQLRFDIDPINKSWVMKSLATKWRDWKARLKAAHYNTHETDEERIADCNERVLPDQWAALVSYWSSEEVEKRCATNRANRAKQKFGHASGTKSFARIREEQKAKRSDGKEPSRAELFILTRTRKNGNPVNEASSAVIKKLRDLSNQPQDASQNSTNQDEMFSQVMGQDGRGRVRAYGVGPTPNEIVGLKPSRAEALKMVSTANSEMREMKEKMATMEQTCAQMAAQMAAMMSMMSSMQKNSPNKKVPHAAGDTSGTSGGSFEQHVNTTPSPCTGSTPEMRTRGRKRKA